MGMNIRIAAVAVVAATALATFACAGGKSGGKSPARATGADVGAWTQDYDAALKLAKEKDLPVLVNFTGSDWCPWCILMEKQVFTTEKWSEWAKEHVVMAFIDFPKDKTRVPMGYVTRNRELQEKFEIEGYPTYIVLAPDGEKVLGQLGASRTATPEKFIADFEELVGKKQE